MARTTPAQKPRGLRRYIFFSPRVFAVIGLRGIEVVYPVNRGRLFCQSRDTKVYHLTRAEARRENIVKAWRYTEGLGPEHLKIVELPDPVPGPGEAVVRVRACSLNYRDLAVMRGAYGGGVKAPLIPLSDGAGEVTDAGPRATRVKPGDHVAAIFMQDWLEGNAPDDAQSNSALGGSIDGMIAEKVCLKAEGLVHYPSHLSFE